MTNILITIGVIGVICFLIFIFLPAILVIFAFGILAMFLCWAVGVPLRVTTTMSDGTKKVERLRWFTLS